MLTDLRLRTLAWASADQIVQKTFVVPLEGEYAQVDSLARRISTYFTGNNYKIKEAGETITCVWRRSPSSRERGPHARSARSLPNNVVDASVRKLRSFDRACVSRTPRVPLLRRSQAAVRVRECVWMRVGLLPEGWSPATRHSPTIHRCNTRASVRRLESCPCSPEAASLPRQRGTLHAASVRRARNRRAGPEWIESLHL